MSTTLTTHHVLADDGTLACLDEESSSDSIHSLDSVAALIRPRFHYGSATCVFKSVIDCFLRPVRNGGTYG